MTKQALGKGFDGLIPIGFSLSDVTTPGERMVNIEITKLEPNPEQPRKFFDETAILELARSIEEHGIIQPLIVTPKGKSYRIIAGERRFRAAKYAKLAKIPVVIRNHKELEELEIALVENVQRVDLSPLETAISILRLRDQFSLSTKEIANKLGKAETTIKNIIRLLQLPEEAVQALQANKITEGHARAVLALKPNLKQQLTMLNLIIKGGWTVRQAEAYVQKQKRLQSAGEQKSSSIDAKLESKLKYLITKGINISIQQRKVGGNIIVAYKNETELQGLLEQF